ncbi:MULTISPECIES: hypothetical protein [Xanthomonas]|uniref:hypothetical protein n=1 Tax=Xanthomonas TaxID=338 RepID=UPI0013DF4ED8|nr:MULTISPECIES: hypothetical protein [Xanthomonas]WDJ86135.1 hypothetical protein JH279_05820 [Xanthomonas campestris pv. incanae]WDK24769.1 hypothetical protein JH274_15860 [Xanthomonas campestris pv. incanae]
MKREEALEAAVKLTAALLHSDSYGPRGNLDQDSELAVRLFEQVFRKLEDAEI